MELITKTFHELNLEELYQILKLRNAVFVVEQNCPYQDIDDKDQESIHLFYKERSKIIAIIRIIPGERPAIGRVVVDKDYRNKGLARKIMIDGLNYIYSTYGAVEIKLQAQTYLLSFYESLGFNAVSEEYLEDDIPHKDMIKKPK